MRTECMNQLPQELIDIILIYTKDQLLINEFASNYTKIKYNKSNCMNELKLFTNCFNIDLTKRTRIQIFRGNKDIQRLIYKKRIRDEEEIYKALYR